ncbi:hypothetical protein DFJ63DRAFT_153083 [Scheffersomyces coipomensis]|uniref:uncharacterized protein n=1 Tax=Scheffersomyces coipomensis TaxID=1788519 RepID=UPI00315C7752
MKSLGLLLIPTLVSAIWTPETGGDWSQLKPESSDLPGSLDTVSFPFGIVVSPYVLNNEGEYEEPTISSVVRSLTTTVITAAPKPTRSIDIINQIEDGQVQKSPSSGSKGDDEEDDDCIGDDNESVGVPIEEPQSPAPAQPQVPMLNPVPVEEEVEEVECLDDDYEEPVKKRSELDYDYDDNDDDENYLTSPVYAVACSSNTTLQMTLTDSILRDSSDRIGCIVSGHQFQFDGPVPQYGALYAAGWSITNNGQLALGNSTKFYQCASGEFYNLYDQPIGLQCQPVTLDVVELIEC